MQGLSVSFYNNPDLSGQPASFGLGIGSSTTVNWGTGVPDPAITAAAWSLRMTGVVNFPQPALTR